MPTKCHEHWFIHKPISYEELIVKKLFVDGKTYTGTKSIFYSAKLIDLHIFIVPHTIKGLVTEYDVLRPQTVVEGQV